MDLEVGVDAVLRGLILALHVPRARVEDLVDDARLEHRTFGGGQSNSQISQKIE